MKEVIAVFGPTGSGKTSLVHSLVQESPDDTLVISTDSRKVYQELTIGTHKTELLKLIERYPALPVFGIDLITPDESMNASVFQEKAYHWLSEKLKGKSYKRLILFGGTGLFLDSVMFGLPHRQVPPNEKLRKNLESKTIPELQILLQEQDPENWQIMNESDRSNPRRLIRRLEIAQGNSKFEIPNSKHKAWPEVRAMLATTPATLYLPNINKEELFVRIDARVDKMIAEGWVEEVKQLLAKYSPDCPGLQIMGYKELVAHLKQAMSLAETIDSIKLKHRRYAKRQLTWSSRYTRERGPYVEMVRPLKGIRIQHYS